MKVSTIHPAVEVTPCSFERIYFSRGSDCDIYNERKELGRLLTENILKSVGYDELYVGLETAYAPAVKLINKGFTVEEAYENIGKLKEAGMKYSALLQLRLIRVSKRQLKWEMVLFQHTLHMKQLISNL